MPCLLYMTPVIQTSVRSRTLLMQGEWWVGRERTAVVISMAPKALNATDLRPDSRSMRRMSTRMRQAVGDIVEECQVPKIAVRRALRAASRAAHPTLGPPGPCSAGLVHSPFSQTGCATLVVGAVAGWPVVCCGVGTRTCARVESRLI